MRQIGNQRLDSLFSDDTVDAHSAYWFTEPDGGWPTPDDRVVVPSAPPGDVGAVTAARPDHETWRAPLAGQGLMLMLIARRPCRTSMPLATARSMPMILQAATSCALNRSKTPMIWRMR